MLSLSPRYDLFRFTLPNDFLDKEIAIKYDKIINKLPGVITNSIDYLNESIQGINFPGIQNILVEQTQHGYHSSQFSQTRNSLRIEPSQQTFIYQSSNNPLACINKEFTLTFRYNQGLYNYFMLYENILLQMDKTNMNNEHHNVFMLELLNESGKVISKIYFRDILLDSIEGLEFNYSKVEREAGTFNATFKFNNIDFEFIELS
jgi:hypothetical protein